MDDPHPAPMSQTPDAPWGTLAGMDLDAVHAHVPRAHYPADPDCDRCGGTGYDGPRKVIVIARAGVSTEARDDEGSPCMCLFIASAFRADVREAARALVNRTA